MILSETPKIIKRVFFWNLQEEERVNHSNFWPTFGHLILEANSFRCSARAKLCVTLTRNSDSQFQGRSTVQVPPPLTSLSKILRRPWLPALCPMWPLLKARWTCLNQYSESRDQVYSKLLFFRVESSFVAPTCLQHNNTCTKQGNDKKQNSTCRRVKEAGACSGLLGVRAQTKVWHHCSEPQTPQTQQLHAHAREHQPYIEIPPSILHALLPGATWGHGWSTSTRNTSHIARSKQFCFVLHSNLPHLLQLN